MKRHHTQLVAIALLAITLAGCHTTPTGNVAKQDELTIGVIAPLSGELATYDQGALQAARLAAAEINAQGGLHIRIVATDSPCDPAQALSAYNKVTTMQATKHILGPICSSELLAIAPTANEEHVVVISPSATSPDVTEAGNYIFRDVASDDLRANVFAHHLIEEDVKEIALLYETDDAGVGFKEAFSEAYTSLGGTITANEAYEKGATDMRTQLLKIKETNPDHLLLLSYPAETGRILKQAAALDMHPAIYEGFEVMSDPQVATIAGELVRGVTYIQAAAEEGEARERFTKAYTETYGEEPPYYAAEAYDIVYLYATAWRQGNVKDALYTIKDFDGASGTITFDANGDVIKPFDIGTVA